MIAHTLNQIQATGTSITVAIAPVTPSTMFLVLPEYSLKIQIPKSLTEVLINVHYCSISIPKPRFFSYL